MRIKIVDGQDLKPSTLEDIDFALFDYINDKLNLFSTTNKGWRKVPLTWVVPERAFQIKNSRERTDTVGNIILPAMSLERTEVNKDFNKKGKYWGFRPDFQDAQGGNITITRVINQKKTSEFANAESFRLNDQENFPNYYKAKKITGVTGQDKADKVVYEYITIPQPVYVECSYALTIRTEYQQQMNELLTPFITNPRSLNYFSVARFNHMYEGFIDGNYNIKNNVSDLAQDERTYETNVTIRILGYLLGDGKNDIKPIISRRENPVQIRIGRERTIFGDIPDHLDNEGKYRR